MLNIHIQHAGKNSRGQRAKKESIEFLLYLFDVLVIFSKLLGEKKLLEGTHWAWSQKILNPSSAIYLQFDLELPRWLSGEESACQYKRHRRCRFNPWVRKIWRRKWQPTPVFLPAKSHGQRSLVGYGPRGPKEWDTTEPLTFDLKHWQFSNL